MREINGTEKQKKLVRIVLEEKEVPLIISDIEGMELSDTKYKSAEKFEYDRKVILETPWNVSVVLQNKTSKISEIVDINLQRNGITDVSGKKIFSALRAKYKSSNIPDINDLGEKIWSVSGKLHKLGLPVVWVALATLFLMYFNYLIFRFIDKNQNKL